MKRKDQTLLSRKMFKVLVIAVGGLAISISVKATTCTFNGTTNTDWATSTNWSPSLPTTGDIVVIASNVIIANGTTVNIASLTLNSGKNITNNGTLNITASGTTNRAVNFNGNNTFDNEGTLSIDASVSGTANPIQFTSTGNTFTFNGTNTLKAATGKTLFAIVGSATINGSGFTIANSGAMADYGVFTITTASASLTNNCTNITIYEGIYNVFYLSGAVSVTNNGTINTYTTTTGTVPHTINAYNQTVSTVSTFTNYGMLSCSGFEQPLNFGGTAGSCKFENKSGGTISSTYPGISSGTSSSTCGILSANNLSNVFINSGTMSFNASGNAIKLSALSGGDSFTNSGAVNITKGSITSAGTTIATSPTINNNSGGVISFNYGVSAGTTPATGWAIISNNSGATINGSCTFAAGTLLTNSGSTLSPGDYTGGVSGIGIMFITPTSSAFTLSGNVNIQVNGKTTAGTDYDQISFVPSSNTCALTLTNANTLTVAVGYTPATNDRISVISTTTKSGAFTTTTVPAGWHIDYATATDIAAKYAAVTWIGGSDNLWSTAANWSSKAVPVSTTDVSIGAYTVNNSGGSGVNSLSLTGSNLTNSGTLTISPASSKDGINLNASTFDNEGTLSITSNYRCIELTGTSTLTFNGTTNFTGSKAFVTNNNSTTTISGTGFTIGSIGTPSSYGLISTTSSGSLFTINSGTSINIYSNSGDVIYMGNSAGITNNGTLNIYTSTTGASVHAINIYQQTASTTAIFTNYGTLLMSGFEQPANFGGTTGSCKFENKSTGNVTSTYPGISSGTASGSLGILSSNNLSNTFINSGAMTLNASGNAIKLNAAGDTFTNNGTITITKGNIASAWTSGSFPVINNNSAGVINFNYGVSAGTTGAISNVVINNNNGATINGSCTFAAGTLVTNSGSTLSPGDFSGGMSGIGKMIITPSSGTFTLAGNVNLQVNGKTTAGTDYDQIAFASTCALTLSGNPVINLSVGYSPTYNDRISVINSSSLSGTLGSSSLPAGWITDYASTDIGVKFPVVVPDAPASVTATAGNAKASIAFTAPISNGGASITSYTVTTNTGGFSASGSSSPITISGLSNGTAYTFTVTATNSAGTGSGTTSGSITPDATAYIFNVTTPTSINSLTTTPVSDISVSNAATLTVNIPATVNSVTVNSNSKLDLSSNTLTVSDLILKVDKTTAPSVSVTNGMTVSGTVKLLKTLDNTKWYFISFPCNVAVDAITQISGSGTLGTIGTNWWIKYYDGASRAVNLGTQSNWKQKNSGETLYANQGYIIGLSNSLTGDYVLSFPLNKSVVTSAESAKTVTVAAYGEGTSTPANSVGWNLVGIPYLSKFAGSGVGAAFLTLYNGTTYTQSTNTGVSNINPYDAFFIQASTTGTNPTTTNLAFSLGSRQLVRNIVDVDTSERVQINLTNESGTDNTNLIMDDTQLSAYEINRDLEKWLTTGTNIPQIYTQLDGINYAFNGLPINDVVNLPIGIYTKNAGLTTISANAAQAPGLSKLLLTDNSTNPATVTDLLTSDYSFTAVSGTDNARFVITAQQISTANIIETDTKGPKLSIVNCQLLINDILPSSTVRIFDAIGKMVINKSISNNSMIIQLSAKGIYTIQIESGVRSWIKKIVNQ